MHQERPEFSVMLRSASSLATSPRWLSSSVRVESHDVFHGNVLVTTCSESYLDVFEDFRLAGLTFF